MSKVLEDSSVDEPVSESPAIKRVLWVDDDPHLAAGFARRLRRHGIQVIHALDEPKVASACAPDTNTGKSDLESCQQELQEAPERESWLRMVTLELESEIGVGTTFTIRLPLED